MFRILVVEDDPSTRKLMTTLLRANGYDPVTAEDGLDALDVMDRAHVDALLLDVMMPRMDGYSLAAELRDAGCMLPILMITAKSTADDKKRGLRLGVDDYMVKPVDEEEMLLRLAALLRRARIAAERKLVVGRTELDYDSMTITHGTNQQVLPKKEFQLLFQLLSYPNKIFTRRQLMDELWDLDSESDERTVDVHINRLRDRFEHNHDFDIVTVRGLGYKAVKRTEL